MLDWQNVINVSEHSIRFNSIQFISFHSVLKDDKKLDVTLNLFKKLNTGGSFDELTLSKELDELEKRMSSEGKPAFLQEKLSPSKFPLF